MATELSPGTASPPRVGKYSATLDMARFIAAMLLVVAHALPVGLINENLHIALTSGIFSTVFFALSGYIICSTSSFWRSSYPTFAVRRVVRLLPIHWLSCLLLLPWAILGLDRLPLPSLASAVPWWLSGLQGFSWAGQFDLYANLNGPAWSITPLLYGALLLPVLKTRLVSGWNARTLAAVLLLLWAARLAATFSAPVGNSPKEIFLRHIEPIPHMLEIAIAGMTAVLMATPGLLPLRRRLASDAVLLSIVCASAALLGLAVQLFGRLGGFYLIHGPYFPIALLLIIAAHANTGSIEAFCHKPWVKTAGEMSILVFLLHFPVIEFVHRASARVGFPPSSGTLLPLTALVLLGTCALSCALLPPFRRLQKTFSPAPPPPSQP